VNAPSRCGTVAIVGRPNVGKSTLLNHLLGQKLAITSRKPQTTRHTLLGIHTRGSLQIAFVDTPGIHARGTNVMNRRMNRAALGALHDVDVILFLVDRDQFGEEDELVLGHIAEASGRAPAVAPDGSGEDVAGTSAPVPEASPGSATGAPRAADARPRRRPVVIAVVNKVDRLPSPDAVLPVLAALDRRFPFDEIVPVSALRSRNLDRLEEVLARYVPEGPHQWDEDELTDRPVRFLVAEIIREKLMRKLGDELPYQCAVSIESFRTQGGRTRIQAQILVEKASQRMIVIGRGGSRLRDVGREARLDVQRLVDGPVHLELWVKVRQGWADNAQLLAELGLDDPGS
jgi:GTP-binding protein Era